MAQIEFFQPFIILPRLKKRFGACGAAGSLLAYNSLIENEVRSERVGRMTREELWMMNMSGEYAGLKLRCLVMFRDTC